VVNARLHRVEEITGTALEIARGQNMARTGDPLVITAGVPLGTPGSTNLLRIEQLS